MALDLRAVGRGAVGAAALFGPIAFVLRALAGGDVDSNNWLLLLVLFPFAFMFGGWLAAYDRPPTPLVHGAIAAAAGFLGLFLLILPFRLADGRFTLASAIFAVLLAEAAALCGLLGGLLASRGVRVPR